MTGSWQVAGNLGAQLSGAIKVPTGGQGSYAKNWKLSESAAIRSAMMAAIHSTSHRAETLSERCLWFIR